MTHTFTKNERLSSKKAIGKLFTEGKNLKVYPLLVHYRVVEKEDTEYPVQVVIGARKKSHKRAVVRNLLKRRIREAYRLNKSMLYTPLLASDKHIHLSFVYIGNEIKSYAEMEEKIQLVFKKLSDKFTNKPTTK